MDSYTDTVLIIRCIYYTFQFSLGTYEQIKLLEIKFSESQVAIWLVSKIALNTAIGGIGIIYLINRIKVGKFENIFPTLLDNINMCLTIWGIVILFKEQSLEVRDIILLEICMSYIALVCLLSYGIVMCTFSCFENSKDTVQYEQLV